MALWSGTDWPGRLRRSVELGGGARPAGPPRPRLDRRAVRGRRARPRSDARRHVGVRDFLSRLVAQQIPADTLAERGARGAAVRLLTAHRSKGLEWRLVVVAHVQQDGWPDLRRRSTLLQADRIGAGRRLVPPVDRRASCCGGAPAVLRRLHPRPRAARRHRGRLRRGRRRAAVAVPRRARRHRREGRRPAAPAAVAGRAGERAAPHRRRPRHRRAAARRPPPAGWPAWRASRSAAARSCRRPTRRRGGAPAPPAGRSSRSATPTSRCRCRPACSSRVMTCPTQWFLSARPAASARPTSRPTSARSCTRSPSGSPPASSTARPSTC